MPAWAVPNQASKGARQPGAPDCPLRRDLQVSAVTAFGQHVARTNYPILSRNSLKRLQGRVPNLPSHRLVAGLEQGAAELIKDLGTKESVLAQRAQGQRMPQRLHRHGGASGQAL